LLGKEIRRGKVYYKVQWADYEGPPTWEPEGLVNDAAKEEYEKLADVTLKLNYEEPKKGSEDEEFFEVEELLDKRRRDGGIEYLVKWKDCKKPSWQPSSNINEPAIEEWNNNEKERLAKKKASIIQLSLFLLSTSGPLILHLHNCFD